MLPLPVTAQGLQLVSRRRGEDAQLRRSMQLHQFSQRHTLKRTEAPGMLIVEELLGFPRRKALNHTQTILRVTLYVNRRSRVPKPSVEPDPTRSGRLRLPTFPPPLRPRPASVPFLRTNLISTFQTKKEGANIAPSS